MADRPWYHGLADDVPSPDDLPLPIMPATRENGAEGPPVGGEDEAPPVVTVRDAIHEWITEEQRGNAGSIYTGWPTIDYGLDKPIRPGEVIAIGARTGVGKTWGIQAIMEHVLRMDDTAGVAIIEMEMPAFHFAERLVSHALDLSPRQARTAAGKHELDADRIVAAHGYLERIVIIERHVSVAQIPAVIAAVRAANVYPTAIAVDYTGLFKWTGPRTSTYDRASENARQLKEIAKQERVIILAAVQLSRAAGDGTVEPTLEDFRDSGAIEEAADRCLMMWREAMVDETGGAQRADGLEVYIKIAKNRFGNTGYKTHCQYDHALRLREVGDDQETLGTDDVPF